ncbi:hypothetical protein TWF281_000209 [Arthrobotrys megalospora]
MSNFSRPSRRDEFDTAIICALRLEFDAVAFLFDEFWDTDGNSYGKVPGDGNTYMAGRIGNRNVVLVLPGMGKVNAASAAANIITSYNRVQLALVVGICGGVPYKNDGTDIFLGDVIISESSIQHDFGRLYPDGHERKEGLLDNLGKPSREIITFVKTLQTKIYLERLLTRAVRHLDTFQHPPNIREGSVLEANSPSKYEYPGMAKDKLFEPTYPHKHHQGCSTCSQGMSACQQSRELSCSELHCDEAHLERQRIPGIGEAWKLVVHFGPIASGDSVIKSAEDRDKRAKEMKAIAFEMAGAGVWDTLPCIIVKSVCDYAYSHKNEEWQNFAAATAASAARALLELHTPPDKSLPPIAKRSDVPLIEGNATRDTSRQSNRINAASGGIIGNNATGNSQQENIIGPVSPDSGPCVIL